MKLSELLGEELYAKVDEKLNEVNSKEPDKLKHIRYADLSEGEYVSKSKYESVSGEKKNLEEQINTLNATIKTLKKDNGDNENLQETIDKLQKDLTAQKEMQSNLSKTFALKEQLTKNGVLDPDYLIYKAGGIDKFNFDKEGNPVGVDDSIKPYKEDVAMAHLFKVDKKPPYNPKNGGIDDTNNPFAKDTYNLTKQGELFKNDPARARELAAAAGVTI